MLQRGRNVLGWGRRWMSSQSGGVLENLTVLDLTRALSGPFATSGLCDMGARVIKVERLGVGDESRHWGPPYVGEGSKGYSTYFAGVSRGKESLALDWKSEGGRRVLWELACEADVVLENNLPGTLEKYGIGYEQVVEVNPGVVYCSLSGFGGWGPDSHRGAYDMTIGAESGLMSATGEEDGPPLRCGVAVSDLFSGLVAQNAVVAALLERERDVERRGRLIDVGMLDAQLMCLANLASAALKTNQNPPRVGNGHTSIAPYNVYTCADGRQVVIAAMNDAQFARFCSLFEGVEASGEGGDKTTSQIAALVNAPREETFKTNPKRVTNRRALNAIITAALTATGWSGEEFVERATAKSVSVAFVRTIPEALQSPQAQARHAVVETTHPVAGSMKLVAPAAKFMKRDDPSQVDYNASNVRAPPPLLGEHTRSILVNDLGWSEEQVQEAVELGYVATA